MRPGGHDVLDRVDLVVPAGSLATLTGPSGVGKTTLLRAIAGLQEVDEGSILLGDRELDPVPPHARGIAFVFQRPRLFPHMDVADNVSFPLRMRGVPGGIRRDRALAVLEEVGLSALAGRSPRRLSGGEAQRVALARALVGEPALLLLDEPLASVDPDLRRSLRTLLQRLLRDRGTTAVYVTHDQSEAAELGDVVAVMLRGRIAQVGAPTELFERPADVAVARFFGIPNVLRGEVRDGELDLGGVRLPVSGPDGLATFVIRPQHVQLDGASPLRATVISRSYLGTSDRLQIELSGVELEATLAPGTTPPPGTDVGVVLPPERLWRVADESPLATAPEPSRS